MKPVLGLAATGIVAVLLWKLMLVLLLPIFGVAIGFVFIAIKIVFWVIVGCFAWWLLKKLLKNDVSTA